ncbi:hypothetical protein CCP2SC5_2450002 [Azospirillaceae bacterium]
MIGEMATVLAMDSDLLRMDAHDFAKTLRKAAERIERPVGKPTVRLNDDAENVILMISDCRPFGDFEPATVAAIMRRLAEHLDLAAGMSADAAPVTPSPSTCVPDESEGRACPCCSGAARRRSENGCYRIACIECGLKTQWFDSPDRAMAAWSMRSIDSHHYSVGILDFVTKMGKSRDLWYGDAAIAARATEELRRSAYEELRRSDDMPDVMVHELVSVLRTVQQKLMAGLGGATSELVLSQQQSHFFEGARHGLRPGHPARDQRGWSQRWRDQGVNKFCDSFANYRGIDRGAY